MEALIDRAGDGGDSKLVRGPIRGGGGEEQKQNPSTSLSGLSQKQKRCRNPDWSEPQSTVLINCMNDEEGLFRDRRNFMNWKATGEKIENDTGSPRSKEECQNRSDILIKAYKEVKKCSEGDYKEFFRLQEEGRRVKLSTQLTEEWYEKLEQIKQKKKQQKKQKKQKKQKQQQQKKQPLHLSSSDSDGSPSSLGGTKTPSRSGDTNLISSPENSPSPDPTHPAVQYQTHSSESTELPLRQQMPQAPPATNCPGVAQEVHPNLHEEEDSSALGGLDYAPSDLELPFGWFDQEAQDCYNFSAQYFPMIIEQDVESSSDFELWD